MSIDCLNAVFKNSKASGGARNVLLAIADRANDNGVCWPGIADTAQRANLSESQTRRCIKTLIAIGELSIKKRGGGWVSKGRGRPNEYLVTVPPAESSIPDGDSNYTRVDAQAPHAHVRSLPLHQRAATLAPTPGEPTATNSEPIMRIINNIAPERKVRLAK